MTPYDLPAPLPLSRRAALGRVGLAAAAIAGLGGCTNYGASSGAPSSSAPSAGASASGGGSAGGTIKTADIPVGGGTIFADVQAVVTQPTKGAFKAFSSICTHAQCPLFDVTTTINCKCHGSQFSIEDGSVVHDPATTPLPARTVTVKGDSLTVS